MKFRLDVPPLLFFLALGVFSATRGGLAVYAYALTSGGDVPLYLWPIAFAKGVWFDLAVLAFLLAPLLFYEAILGTRIKKSRWHRALRFAFIWIVASALLFGAVAEFAFWTEFATRFNFIAVDYLLYTHEVIGNIQESYPVGAILIAIGVMALGITWGLRRSIAHADDLPMHARRRWSYVALAIALPLISYGVVSVEQMEGSGNTYIDELSGNGLYSLAAAMRRNELDYDRFYQVLPQAEADAVLARLGVERAPLTNVTRVNVSTHGGRRMPFAGASAKANGRPRHVILVSIESLSASFLGAYGSTEGLTPNLDRLAREGWQFNRVFATGTRTVRGLEALSIGTPPIPGQSIVRRPDNAHLATLGGVLKRHGYAADFIYGGYGYFDNMNAYFAGNGYNVVDRTDFDDASIVFENVWGVADESLFDNALKVIDEQVREGRPVFAHIMTTSNHRPYSYPEGRIDLPQGKRAGAVKYTDYAVGKLIRDASAKPWFKDALFVFVADHCASVAGKTRLPVDKYRIPLIMYAPRLLKPATFDMMMSQIDIAPTLLDMLGIPGGELFYGQSLFRPAAANERAFISNYQELGYIKNDVLTVLSPKRKAEAFAVDPLTFETTPRAVDEILLKEAIAYYETASRSFKNGDLRMDGNVAAVQ